MKALLERVRKGSRRRAILLAATALERIRRTPQQDANGADPGVLFVCLGNICRSPLAEGLFRAKLDRLGLAGRVRVDSAGTSTANAGRTPDGRARLVAARHGIRIDDVRARGFRDEDFAAFDRIVAFDRSTRDELLGRARNDDERRRVSMLADDEIADPILGGLGDFERTYRAIDVATDRLVSDVRTDLERGS